MTRVEWLDHDVTILTADARRIPITRGDVIVMPTEEARSRAKSGQVRILKGDDQVSGNRTPEEPTEDEAEPAAES